jgi:hypothetical protein
MRRLALIAVLLIGAGVSAFALTRPSHHCISPISMDPAAMRPHPPAWLCKPH